MNFREKSKAMAAERLERIKASEREAEGHAATPKTDRAGAKAMSEAPAKAKGGAVEGKAAKARMDRGAMKRRRYATGGVVSDAMPSDEESENETPRSNRREGRGRTTVNVVIAPQAGQPAPTPVPQAVPVGLPPIPPPAPPPMPPAGMPPGLPMRKRGGRVHHAGAGSGLGRLEKAGKRG